MQLKKKKARQLRDVIGALSATLLSAAALQLDSAAAQSPTPSSLDAASDNNFGPGSAYSEVNAAMLVYQETGGRVTAVEPSAALAVHMAGGSVLNFEAIADAVSGATPNGAVPSSVPQFFITPLKGSASGVSSTSASGGSTVIQLPNNQLARQYMVPSGETPEDFGFKDRRNAFNVSWSQPLGAISLVGLGGGYSREHDYQASTAHIDIAQTFNSNNTTLSLSLNSEFDNSYPFGGVRTPLSVMSGETKALHSHGKSQYGFVAGLTQTVSRHWLMQINYAFDQQKGYQNDPYRILSVVDPASGNPISSIYENRPGNRASQSLYWDNKLDYGRYLTDVSARFFTDSWGIKSGTIDVAERVELYRSLYIEPSLRWYSQSAANFYRYFLAANQPMPAFASSDTRLGSFDALTYGIKLGFNVTERTEFYVNSGYYIQSGNSHPANAIGQLRNDNLFPASKAGFLFVGYTWDFH